MSEPSNYLCTWLFSGMIGKLKKWRGEKRQETRSFHFSLLLRLTFVRVCVCDRGYHHQRKDDDDLENESVANNFHFRPLHLCWPLFMWNTCCCRVERRGVMRLLPTLSLVVLTLSALAIIKYTSYDDTTSSGLSRSSQDGGGSSGKRSRRSANGTAANVDSDSHADEDGSFLTSIQHRFKRSFFSHDSCKLKKSLYDIFKMVISTLPRI